MFCCAEKTERMAENHYKRVTNFAKEMLVWPDEIQVHKIKNPRFLSDVKPTSVVPAIHTVRGGTTRNSVDHSTFPRGAGMTTQRTPSVH